MAAKTTADVHYTNATKTTNEAYHDVTAGCTVRNIPMIRMVQPHGAPITKHATGANETHGVNTTHDENDTTIAIVCTLE